MPIGVVIGPLSAIPFRRTESSVVSGQRSARGLHHVDAGLLDIPLETDAGRVEHAAGGLGEFGPGAVAGNQGDRVHAAEHSGTVDGSLLR